MRIVFMGTPDFAVPTLDALVAAGHEIAAVYSQPPRPARRGQKPTPSPVHARAEALGLAVRTPLSLRDAGEKIAFSDLHADVAVVAAYGLILPRAVLDAPRLGCLNVHGSLLPRWRGAAPVQRAILAGDRETGVGIMQMESGLDTGPVRLEARTPIDGKTAGELTQELAQMGAAAMVRVLDNFASYPAVPQTAENLTYAHKIDKAEARIEWNLSAVQIERSVRAFNPAPGAWFEIAGERFKLLAAEVLSPTDSAAAQPPGTVIDDALTIACNPGAIRPLLVQRAGRGAMTAHELLRGFAVPVGTRLG
jgi:methionyl-tRNA formyltransferase